MKEFTVKTTNTAKGFAILLMLNYHLFTSKDLMADYNINNLLPDSLFEMWAGYGNMCVAIFLFLSAFGITKSLAKYGDDLKAQYAYSFSRYLKLTINFIIAFWAINLAFFSKIDYRGIYGEGKQAFFLWLMNGVGFSHIFDSPSMCGNWWYLSAAVACIFSTPAILLLYKKIGRYTLPVAMFLPCILSMNYDFWRYYLAAVLGIIFASDDLFIKMHDSKSINKYLKIAITLLLLIISIPLRQNYMVYKYYSFLVDPVVAVIICYAVYELIPDDGIIAKIFGFIGKHSMNMYFVHYFFYGVATSSFIYSQKAASISFLLLAVMSLLFSVVLEAIKKLCRVDKLLAKI